MSISKIQTVVYVFRSDGKVVLGYQPLSAPFCAGKLKPPGGRAQLNETPKDCAVRETREETSVIPVLDEKPLGIIHITHVDGPTIELCVYRAMDYNSEPQSIEKLERVGWYDINDATISQMMEDNRSWIGYVQRGEEFTADVTYDTDGNLLTASAHRVS